MLSSLGFPTRVSLQQMHRMTEWEQSTVAHKPKGKPITESRIKELKILWNIVGQHFASGYEREKILNCNTQYSAVELSDLSYRSIHLLFI